jgi:5-methylcytosine-specific restriction endonuclease McrBC GTP-binding regulatory subunit McrB
MQPNQLVDDDASEADLRYEDKKSMVKAYWNNKPFNLIGKDKSNPFVFIIDEINRGNIAQIFGELITLIEKDKRLGQEEEIRLQLPYSKDKFCVPPNLYIIGTMNTADRSVEALDTALRRRFSFIPMMPQYDKLSTDCDGIDLNKLLETVNDRLKILKDKDHTIGHAWLWNVKNPDDLRRVFEYKIIPLLQEYFYNDYEKLGLVLGDRFVKKELVANTASFAIFTEGSVVRNQYSNKKVFTITESYYWDVDAFQSIYQPTSKQNGATPSI